MNTRPDVQYTELSEFTLVSQPDKGLHLEIAPEAVPAFIQLVRRGVNTWDVAPTGIKQLSDILTGVPTKK